MPVLVRYNIPNSGLLTRLQVLSSRLALLLTLKCYASWLSLIMDLVHPIRFDNSRLTHFSLR